MTIAAIAEAIMVHTRVRRVSECPVGIQSKTLGSRRRHHELGTVNINVISQQPGARICDVDRDAGRQVIRVIIGLRGEGALHSCGWRGSIHQQVGLHATVALVIGGQTQLAVKDGIRSLIIGASTLATCDWWIHEYVVDLAGGQQYFVLHSRFARQNVSIFCD